MIRIVTSWPQGLRDDDLLDLSVRTRSRGEKLSMWRKEAHDLVVLFDGKVGNSLGDYEADSLEVVPGAYLIFDSSGFSMANANVAGVRIERPDNTLTYHYQKKWGGSYPELAKKHNETEACVPIPFLWTVYTQMNFAWYQNAPREYLEPLQNSFIAFGSIVAQELVDMDPVHVPLILDPDEKSSLQ